MDNIIINLSESRNAQKFSKDNLIHVKEFERVNEWIDQRLKDIDKITEHGYNDNRSESVRLHETITVLGTRGSGKTSFLLSVLDECSKKDIEIINIIDPTLIEEKGHIFLTILSEIDNHVNKALNDRECSPERQDYFNKKKWNDQLKQMAKGLPAMDIINNGYQDWCDPEYVMNTGLQNVYAARTLEANFHKSLKLGLEILGKKAFIIALDDIDVDFRKGWPVLETIRKYMTSPYIIILLSGDLRLFSKAIRKQQWKNFGKSLLKNEGDNLQQMRMYNNFVTEMEAQYTLKVIQPRRRVYLTTLKEKIDTIGTDDVGTKGIHIQIAGRKKDKYGENIKIDIVDRYRSILSEFGIRNPYQMEVYQSFLLGLPLRTQIQFLSIFDDANKSAAEKQDEIVETFLSEMYEKGVAADMIKMDKRRFMAAILRLLIKEKVLNESYQMQPTSTDTNLNITLMVLNFIACHKIQESPYLIFDYFIRIGYIRNILSVLGYQTNDKNILSSSIEHLCEFVGIYRDMELRDLACLITAYLQADRKNNKANGNYYGIINLQGLAQKQKKSGNKMQGRIDTVFNEEDNIFRNIAFLPLSFSQNNRVNMGQLSYSIFVLLAAIGDLIRKSEAKTLKGLASTAQLKSYPMPVFEGGKTSGEMDMDIEISENKYSDLDERIINDFADWVGRFGRESAEEHPLSLHVLGKICTRLFYGLSSIESNGIKENANLGDSMHIRIVLFLNSVLIEEVKELYPDKINKLNINNPVTSDQLFINNLNSINKDGLASELKFTQWICSCPLLLAFLKLEDKNWEVSLLNFIGDDSFYDKIKAYHIYNKLTKVKIAKEKPRKKQSGNNVEDIVNELRNKVDYNIFTSYSPTFDQKDKKYFNTKIRTALKPILPGINMSSRWIKRLCEYILAHSEIKW